MKKTISMILYLILMCVIISCNQAPLEEEGRKEIIDRELIERTESEEGMISSEESEKVDVTVYDELIDRIYDSIAEGNTESGEPEGVFSLHVGLGHMSVSDMLAATGYAVEDINDDGIPELILGMVTKLEEESVEGNIIYALYTYADGKPVMVFESFVRNSYSWLGDGRFRYYGSGSAVNSGFGSFILPKKGTKLECEEFWFSDIKPDTDTEIGYYYNTSGSWNPEESEELFVSNEEFWEMEAGFYEQEKYFTFTQLINYKKAEAIDMIDLWWETSTDTHLAAVAYLGYETGDLDAFKKYADQVGILNQYPFIETIDEKHTFLHEGGEWYVVVPNEKVHLNVGEAVLAEATGEVMPGDVPLISEAKLPVLIRGNVSEIYSNIMIELQRNDEQPVSYSPQLSMKDGSLSQSDDIFDFTPYHLLSHYLLEIITDPKDSEYQHYVYRGETISTPVVGNEDPDPILVKALKNNLTIRIEMADSDMLIAERTLMEGDVLFISAELMNEETPLRVFASWENGKCEGYWYAITNNGEKHYREILCGIQSMDIIE